MKLECILKRKEGTRVELGGLEYHFEPLADGAHVAEVADNAHMDRLLAVPEAYKVYHGKLSPKGKPTEVGSAAQSPQASEARPMVGLIGSNQHQSQYEIGGMTYSLGDIVRKAFEKSGLTSDEWNELNEDDRNAKLDIVLDDLADAAEAHSPEPETVRESLVEAYKAKFGKAPHHKTSNEAIAAKLAE